MEAELFSEQISISNETLEQQETRQMSACEQHDDTPIKQNDKRAAVKLLEALNNANAVNGQMTNQSTSIDSANEQKQIDKPTAELHVLANNNNNNDNNDDAKNAADQQHDKTAIETAASQNAAEATSTGGINMCSICTKTFDSIQECYKHELLKHVNNKLPCSKKQRKLQQLTEYNMRGDIQKLLNDCEPDQELNTLCNAFTIDSENLTYVYNRVINCLTKELGNNFEVFGFGSVISGLALRDSDIDIYLKPINKIANWKHELIYNKVNRILRTTACFEKIIAIKHARVPIIKCEHCQTGFSLDINMSSPNSVVNSLFLRNLVQWEPRLRRLFIFMKIWAKHLQIIGQANLNNYCLITLVLFFLQQKSLLPSIKELQANCEAYYIAGINYAYDLSVLTVWPKNINELDLIKQFFAYYKQLDFSKYLIAPYLGKTLLLQNLNRHNYPEHFEQRDYIKAVMGKSPEEFQSQRSMVIQDPFYLSHNIAKSVAFGNLMHFQRCINHAATVCASNNIKKVADFYDQLLFSKMEQMLEIISAKHDNQITKKQLKQQKQLQTKTKSQSELQSQSQTQTQSKAQQQSQPEQQLTAGKAIMMYNFYINRNDIRVLNNYFAQKSNRSRNMLYEFWAEQRLNMVKELLTNVYHVDIQELDGNHQAHEEGKHQRMQNIQQFYRWEMSASVDLWSCRSHQTTQPLTYLAHQLEQTEKLLQHRRQEPSYAIDLKGILTVKISENATQISIYISGHEHSKMLLQTHNPLLKFFVSFKSSLQCYKLKEKLQRLD